MLHTLRFFASSKCRLFHNPTFFGSCIIHIINTEWLKFKRNFQRLKFKTRRNTTLARSYCYSQFSDTLRVAYVISCVKLISGIKLKPLMRTRSVLRMLFMPKDKFQLKQRRKSQVCVESDNCVLFYHRQSVRERMN